MKLIDESPLALADAAHLVSKHVATVYRWTTTGCRGVVLEALQVGGTRCTSIDALQRFCESLTGAQGVPQSRTAKQTVAAQAAAAELEKHGI